MGRIGVRIKVNRNSKEYQDILKELIHCQDRIAEIEKNKYKNDCAIIYWVGRKRGIECCLDVLENIAVFVKNKKLNGGGNQNAKEKTK